MENENEKNHYHAQIFFEDHLKIRDTLKDQLFFLLSKGEYVYY